MVIEDMSTSTINFGRVPENSTPTHEMQFTIDVKKVKCGCGCTVVNIKDKKRIKITANLPKVPQGVLKNGSTEYQWRKTCTIEFTNGEKRDLHVTAKIYKEDA